MKGFPKDTFDCGNGKYVVFIPREHWDTLLATMEEIITPRIFKLMCQDFSLDGDTE